jgi:hypothetical protein
LKYLVILSLVFLVGPAYAATPFFANGGFTENGIEWCEENYQLYQFMGNDFFEHHQHSIESRVCVSLYYDSLWVYSGPDRYEKLIEQSRIYTELEIEESKQEADTGIIDVKPAVIKEIPQDIAQQQKELEEKSDVEPESNRIEESVIEDKQIENSEGGGCLIATATYGSELASQVQQLRELRDNKLLNTESGKSFMNIFNPIYYSFSPVIADYERDYPVFKETVKIAITPLVSSLFILNYVDMDSETEVLGYGISLIALNLVMYVGIPAIVTVGIKKKF